MVGLLGLFYFHHNQHWCNDTMTQEQHKHNLTLHWRNDTMTQEQHKHNFALSMKSKHCHVCFNYDDE